MKPKRPAHWYRLVTEYCPVCGAETRYRIRFSTPKPGPADRYQTYVKYDQCVERDNILQTIQ
mgnify:CR=1 FL=1